MACCGFRFLRSYKIPSVYHCEYLFQKEDFLFSETLHLSFPNSSPEAWESDLVMSGNMVTRFSTNGYILHDNESVFSTSLLHLCKTDINWNGYESYYSFREQRSCCRAWIQFYGPSRQVNQRNVGSVVIKDKFIGQFQGNRKQLLNSRPLLLTS